MASYSYNKYDLDNPKYNDFVRYGTSNMLTSSKPIFRSQSPIEYEKEYKELSEFNSHKHKNHKKHKKDKKEKKEKKEKRRNRSRSRSKAKKYRSKSPKMSDEELIQYLRQRRKEITSQYNNEVNEENEIKKDQEMQNEEIHNESDKENEIKSVEVDSSSSVVKSVIINDMFSDDFKTTPTGAMVENRQRDDNDDSEGYYRIRLGEILNNRYLVFSFGGMGVFSSVFRARDITNNDTEVAIKVIRNNDMMFRTGMQEIKFLEQIKKMQTKANSFCINFIHHFVHKDHLCMVFELLDMNLRSLLDKFGKNVGLNMKAVRLYGQQLLQALKLIKKADIIHGDIKPDNILVSVDKSFVKLSDFGSACNTVDCTITEYFVSRFYRAPEIILGLKYDHSIDMWAVGATLYELYTGKIMFPGSCNNEMLKLIMEARGKFPHKMIKSGVFRDKYFDSQYNFLYKKRDDIFQSETVKMMNNFQSKSFSLNMFNLSGLTMDEENELKQFRDLLDKMMNLNPDNRISIEDALKHSFFQ